MWVKYSPSVPALDSQVGELDEEVLGTVWCFSRNPNPTPQLLGALNKFVRTWSVRTSHGFLSQNIPTSYVFSSPQGQDAKDAKIEDALHPAAKKSPLKSTNMAQGGELQVTDCRPRAVTSSASPRWLLVRWDISTPTARGPKQNI
jgi:hypothetical protein